VLNVAVSASHVMLSCDCGKISVVYSSFDHINTTELSSPILSCNRELSWIQRKGPEYISENNKGGQGETAESEKCEVHNI